MYSRAIWLCKLIFLLFWLPYSPKYPKTWGHNFPTPHPSPEAIYWMMTSSNTTQMLKPKLLT